MWPRLSPTGPAPLPYPALNAAFDPLYPKGIRAYWKGAFLKELPAGAIAAHLEHGSRVPEVSATMHMYPINGACHRVEPTDTAFAYRDAKYGMVFLASWTDPAKDAERIQWVRDYYQALAPYSEPGGYINFMQDVTITTRSGTTTAKTTTGWFRSSGPTTPAISSASTRTLHHKHPAPAARERRHRTRPRAARTASSSDRGGSARAPSSPVPPADPRPPGLDVLRAATACL